MIIK
jgi:hypothetical protein